MMRRVRVLALLLALMVMACGTRASDERFDALVRGANGEGSEAAALDSGNGDAGTFDSGAAPGGTTEAATGDEPGTAGGDGGGAGGDAGGDVGAGATGGDGAGGGGPDAPSGGGGPAAPGPGGGPANVASDVGVTATTIKVGSVVSVNGPLGPRQFSPTFYGMNAYVEWLNSQGGINGRKVILVTCDDRESEEANRRCAERLIEQEKVFALLGNNTRVWDTGAAKYTDDKGVPVVGGYTIGLSYTYFPTIFDFGSGSESGYPRDYKVGQNGLTFTSTSGCVFWSKKGVKRAASIFYSIPISKEAGLNGKSCLEAEGIDVTTYEINPAVPNWDAVAADMQQRKIQAAFDYVDIVANQNLCRALDRRGYRLDYKVSTIAVQARWVKNDFSHPCRESIYIGGGTEPLGSNHPEAVLFRETMSKVYQGRFDRELHQWAFDAWLGGIQFKEAVESMGANVTRKGLMDWYNALHRYECHGLCSPRDYSPNIRKDGQPVRGCVSIVRWDEKSGEFVTWADRKDEANCVTGKWVAEPASYSP